MEARNQALLCQEIESELRELCLECRKKFPSIKEYTERAILKIRHHRDLVEQQGREAAPLLPEFPLDEVLRAILMACETFQNKIVMLSLSCLQRLIHRRVLKDETIAIVINLMKEQASNGDETVQLKVLQTIMATPSHMTLLNELVVEQLLQLLYVLHNSGCASVHHTACAGLRQLAEYLADRAHASAPAPSPDLKDIRPVIRRSPAAGMPTVAPAVAPPALVGPLRMFFIFVQDLCVMADYDATSLSSRYAVDAGERMRTGSREGFWLAAVKFPRPLCLELLGACVGAHPATFAATSECFALLRHNVCAVLLKNMRGCFDFAILIRSIHVLQQIFKCGALASLLMPELQVFLHLMLDLTAADRSPWQRATSLEFLRSVCEDSTALAVLYEHGGGGAANVPGSQTFLELVNSLSKLVHQVCFSSGMDSLGAGAASAQRVDVGRGLRLGGMQLLVPGTDTAARGKLLQLMSETEPPVIQSSLLVALVIESVFAVVSTLYKLLLGEGEEGEEPRPQLCQGMLTDCWASLLSALSVLLHGVADEQCLQQTLRCLRTLLYCCSRLALAQARDACLLQLTRYALPGQAEALSAKNALCFKALLHFCLGFGALLGTAGWSIALRALGGLEHRAPPGSELRQALDSLFETSAQLPPEALLDVVDAMGQGVREPDEGAAALGRLVELCSVNATRLLTVWDRVLRVATDVCMHDERGDLRSAAASALCRILAKALRKTMAEDVQQQLLQQLEPLLRAPFEDARAGLCEGLLQILQAAGQELHTGAWFTMMQLVATAARLELRRSGLEFDDEAEEEEVVVADGREAASAVLPVVFQLLELLVQDFMEYVPSGSVPQLTASIGAFARFTGLGVNSSLTAVGFLWNVADALARYHCSALEELWLQIFMHLRCLAVDTRPEVRNCAVKSLTSALLSHGRKVGTACYRTCLQEILIKVLAEVQQAAQRAREMGAGAHRAESLIVHHSRDTPEKLWDETMVLGVEGVRRVLSHFSEEAGVSAFAPLAYVLLLQVQATLRTLTTEVSGSALRALADLMRIPASSEAFEAEDTLVSNPALPAEGTTSIWQLGWSVLWGLVRFCMGRDMPESLMEIFASTLGALRSSHRQCFTTAQHAIFTQLALVLVTAPSFYLPSQAPLQVEASEEDVQGSCACLVSAAQACAEGGEHAEVFRFVEVSPAQLWNLELRTEQSQLQAYAKAAAPVGKLVDVNQSRSLDVASLEFGLSDAEALLGRSPTHRTMLHISSSRLQHAQNMAFTLLEETHGLPEPGLEVLFLLQCCAVFLDVRRVLLDANKVALAARALCLMVLFCRRLLLRHLAPSPVEPAALAHVEALLGQALPQLCRATCALACGVGCPQLRDSGLCKLALEGLVYLVEDSLPATERCELSAEVAAAYWGAVMGSLAEVVASALPEPAAIEAEADLLSQAVGNLLSQRLMGCIAAPQEASAHAARLLETFVGLGGLRQPGLASLFDLCAQPGVEPGGGGLSLCAASARSGGALQLPAHCPQREALLEAAAPLLLARLRTLFEACAEEPNRHTGEVRCVLSRLQALLVDAAALSALEPASARKACEIAGPRAFAMALLPQLAALATVGDAAVRGGVRLVLEGLSSELGLLGGGGI